MQSKQGNKMAYGQPISQGSKAASDEFEPYTDGGRNTPKASDTAPLSEDPELGRYGHKEHDNDGVPLTSNGAQRIDQADKVVRMGFIRKVYGILTVQLTVTFGITCIFTFNEALRSVAQESLGMFFSAWILSIGFLLTLSCFPQVARTYPQNYICLGAFTLFESYLVGVVSSFYQTDTVLLALGLTISVFLALTVFAWQTKTDFTAASGLMTSFLALLLFTGILSLFIPSLRLVYASLGALLFSGFIVFDTQLILGGEHRQLQFTVDDYVLAALSLYIDVVQLFLYILRLIGDRR
eukprot:gb/GECG01016381.1/.p1 GENE.gb/GECG01016381.1/~~gb/GECG01016381.1/.p1  ORF type:complete len:295 (+),score=20.21 gb/GECG01016381.1/:1-885(+)